MTSPAESASSLLANTIVGGSSGWTLKIGNQIDTPDQLVVFYDTGGLKPNPRWAVDFPTIQVIVRSSPQAYADGWAKAREIRDALLGLQPQVVNGDQWVSITCPGDVGFVAYDNSNRPMFSVNFRLIIEPAQTGLRDPL